MSCISGVRGQGTRTGYEGRVQGQPGYEDRVHGQGTPRVRGQGTRTGYKARVHGKGTRAGYRGRVRGLHIRGKTFAYSMLYIMVYLITVKIYILGTNNNLALPPPKKAIPLALTTNYY